jgi:hypothetical protein
VLDLLADEYRPAAAKEGVAAMKEIEGNGSRDNCKIYHPSPSRHWLLKIYTLEMWFSHFGRRMVSSATADCTKRFPPTSVANRLDE